MILPPAGHSAEERFYIGTFSNRGNSQGIYTGILEPTTGHLGPITLAAKADSPNSLAVSPNASHLYAATDDAGGSISAFKVEKNGSLTFLNRVASAGVEPCHISVDTSGRTVFVANYGSGNITSNRINPDGTLGGRTSTITFKGSGPDPVRQAKPCAHYVSPGAGGRFIYACDLGTDRIWAYHFDSTTGRIQALADIQGKVPPGSGPRHLAFGPGEAFAYVNGEMGRDVTVFRHDPSTGALTPIQTLPLFPGATPNTAIRTSEIRCHPNGRWLYISSRGDDILAVFAVGPDGRLTFVQSVPCLVKEPRGFAIDPSGHWLICAGQDNDQIALLSISPDSGKLTPTGQQAAVPSPVDVLFVPFN